MPSLDDSELDALLAAKDLAEPPAELLLAVAAELRRRPRPAPEPQPWHERLAAVREQFRLLLAQPQLAALAVATRGGDEAGAVAADADSALGHAVQGRNIRGQIFLTLLESPAELEVNLTAEDATQPLETAFADDLGRFRFLGLEPGRYTIEVPELGLHQEVEIRP